MPSDFILKTDDTRPEFATVVKDQDGVIDLTSTTAIRLILKKLSPAVTVTGTCTKMTITAAIAAGLASANDPSTDLPWTAPQLATTCVVRYAWIPADTSSPGIYQGEIELTWGVGLIETIPNDGYFTVEFIADLD